MNYSLMNDLLLDIRLELELQLQRMQKWVKKDLQSHLSFLTFCFPILTKER